MRSLYVYLKVAEKVERQCECESCGNKHTHIVADILYTANITHNHKKIADAMGIGDVLWRPEKIGITRAKELIPLLEVRVKKLQENPNEYIQLSLTDSWSSFYVFQYFVSKYLDACKKWPTAKVSVST